MPPKLECRNRFLVFFPERLLRSLHADLFTPFHMPRFRLLLTASVLSLCSVLPAAHAANGTKENIQQEAATLELKGLLVPYHQANLSSRSTGVIRTMKEEGEEVHKEGIVVGLDDDNEKLAVDSAKSVLDVRQHELASSKDLKKNGSESENNLRIAQANYDTAVIQLKQAQIALDKKYVYAPFDGVVTKRIRQPGEATDNYLPLLTLVDLSEVYFETYLPANRLRDVQPGQTVEITVPDLPGKKFTGKVDFIAPVIDAASGDFRMKILIDNSDHTLRSGLASTGLLPLPPHNAEVQHTGAVTPTPDAHGK